MGMLAKLLSIATAATLVIVLLASPASAAFNRHRLIDNHLFTDVGSMSVSHIQSFLNARGDLLADWEDEVDIYQVDSRFQVPNNRCLVHKSTGMSAAEIIHQASNDWQATYVEWSYQGIERSKNPAVYSGPIDSCSTVKKYPDINLTTISPKVILATLEKEQSLVSTDGGYSTSVSSYYDPPCSVSSGSPYYGEGGCKNNNYKLAWAMGYGVPDTGGKRHQYKGFYMQVMYGSWQLRFNYEHSQGTTNWDGTGAWGYGGPKVGQATTIDGQSVTPQTRATASLYYYTPHIHGNQNFVSIYENWFGSVHANIPYTSLLQPRYMEISADMRKVDLRSGVEVDGILPAGTQIFFPNKVQIGDTWYLRTEHDTNKKIDKGIPLESLDEIQLIYEEMLSPRWMSLKSENRKINPHTKEPIYSTLPTGTKIFFASKTLIGGDWYLRTLHDTENDISAGIKLDDLKDALIEHEEMQIVRWLEADGDIPVYDYLAKSTATIVPEGDITIYRYKTTINNTVYLRTDLPASSEPDLGVKLEDLNEITPSFVSMVQPRYMQTEIDLKKIDLSTGLEVDEIIPTGTQIFFSDKDEVSGVVYLRTKHDTGKNYDKGIPLGSLEEINVVYENMLTPRFLKTKSTLHKIDPITQSDVYGPIPAGTLIEFETKITIDGKVYLRTKHDTDHGLSRVIAYSDLVNID